jgi:hypothetical protein
MVMSPVGFGTKNHCAIRHEEAMHRKYKRLKPGGDGAYDRSSD